jgi:hypothetical protein
MAGPLKAFICGVILNGVIEVKDQEKDGTHVHLVKVTQVRPHFCPEGKLALQAQHGSVHISFNSKDKPLGKEGEQIRFYAEAECTAGFGVDEGMSDKFNRWVTYRSWICNSDLLELRP